MVHATLAAALAEYAAYVIVVVGQPLHRVSDDGASADGLPARIAFAAAAGGRSVQLVGKVGEDPEGDAIVLALAQVGVGHVALLREAGRSTPRASDSGVDEGATSGALDEHVEPEAEAPEADAETESPDVEPAVPATWTTLEAADVDLALRYLTDFAVLVLADPAGPDMVRVVLDAAGWGGARLIVVVGEGQAVPDGLPSDAIVFGAPDADPDGVFASLVGSFAAALDDGDDPAEAFRSAIETDGWGASPEV